MRPGVHFRHLSRPRGCRFPPSVFHRNETQNTSFKASWTCRDEVVVRVISPALENGTPFRSNTLKAGRAKFARLNRLKNSARNCRLVFSLIMGSGVLFTSVKSNFAIPGATIVLRPRLPSKNGVGYANCDTS